MIYLAELNENNICIGIKSVTSMIDDGKHIEVDNMDFEYYSFRKYENGQWSEQKFLPSIVTEVNQPTNSEIAQMISDLQADLMIAGVI